MTGELRRAKECLLGSPRTLPDGYDMVFNAVAESPQKAEAGETELTEVCAIAAKQRNTLPRTQRGRRVLVQRPTCDDSEAKGRSYVHMTEPE